MDKSLIEKKIVYGGTEAAAFRDGAKVFFHFQTRLCDKEKTLIDDSRKIGAGKPLDIVLGKKFKLEVWEVILQRMAINEVAQFVVDKRLVIEYPFVSKTIREAQLPAHARKSHHCAMTLQHEGMGFDDLNNLLKNPIDLEFTMELLGIEQSEEYQKEVWQMNVPEQLNHVTELRARGNEIFKQNKFKEASGIYAEAISILERLLVKRDIVPGPAAFLRSFHFKDGNCENGPAIFVHNIKKKFNLVFGRPERN